MTSRIEPTESSGSNNNNRLQQSCTKCRERKIKCDRNTPCHACVARNCPDKCEYVWTDQDRHHISKAREIESLRRELNQLKRRLADVEEQDQDQQQHGKVQLTRRGYLATPTPTTTNTFEDDYGHANTVGMSSWPVGRPQKRRAGNGDGIGRDAYNNAYVSSGDNFIMPNYGFEEAESLDETTATTNIIYSGFQSQMAEGEHLFSTEHQRSNVSTTITAPLLNQLQQHPQTDFWRGKHGTMKTIYKIVCDCDDFWVPSIIEIVRTSLSPEEAMLSIQRLLLSDNTVMPMTLNGANSQSPTSQSSSAAATSFGNGVDTIFAQTVSPSNQSHSSGEG